MLSVILKKVPSRTQSTPRDLPVPRASQMSRLRAHRLRIRQRRSVGMWTRILGVYHGQSGESDPDLTLLPIHLPCISIFNFVLSYVGLSFMNRTTSSNWGYMNKGMLKVLRTLHAVLYDTRVRIYGRTSRLMRSKSSGINTGCDHKSSHQLAIGMSVRP